jgi:hypothetical protein
MDFLASASTNKQHPDDNPSDAGHRPFDRPAALTPDCCFSAERRSRLAVSRGSGAGPSPPSASPGRRSNLTVAMRALVLVRSITDFRRTRRFRFHGSGRLLVARSAASAAWSRASASSGIESSRRPDPQRCRDSLKRQSSRSRSSRRSLSRGGAIVSRARSAYCKSSPCSPDGQRSSALYRLRLSLQAVASASG